MVSLISLLMYQVARTFMYWKQKILGRSGVGLIVLAALLVATVSKDALVLLGGLAVAYGFQMWPSLIAICWWISIIS